MPVLEGQLTGDESSLSTDAVFSDRHLPLVLSSTAGAGESQIRPPWGQ